MSETDELELNIEQQPNIDYELDDEIKGQELQPLEVPVYADNISLDVLSQVEQYDKFSVFPKTELKFPYLVFSSKHPQATVKSICNGLLSLDTHIGIDERNDKQLEENPDKILEMETCNLYLKDEETDKYLHVTTVPIDPTVVATLNRIALKDSVYFRKSEETPEVLAKPEQFTRFIKIKLDTRSNNAYWQKLLEQEKQQINVPDIEKELDNLYN